MRETTRNFIKRIQDLVVKKILHVDDTPHRLALGVGLGILVAWTPTIGLQMVIVALLATGLKANIQAGVICVWISNPLTIPIVYYPNYLLGRGLVRLFGGGEGAGYSYSQIRQMLLEHQSHGSIWSSFFDGAFWKSLLKLLLDLGVELWVGSLILGVVLGVISYFVSYKLIIWYREHTPHGRRFMRLLKMRKLRQKRKKKRAKEKSGANKGEVEADSLDDDQ